MSLTALAAPAPTVPDGCHGFITDLVLRCGRGEEAALAKLFDLTYFLVSSIVRRDAEPSPGIDDKVVAAFVRIWQYSPVVRARDDVRCSPGSSTRPSTTRHARRDPAPARPGYVGGRGLDLCALPTGVNTTTSGRSPGRGHGNQVRTCHQRLEPIKLAIVNDFEIVVAGVHAMLGRHPEVSLVRLDAARSRPVRSMSSCTTTSASAGTTTATSRT